MEENDSFDFLISFCHITTHQQDLLRHAPIARQHERFATDNSQQEESQYSVPIESVGIRMESPPDDEQFLTPDDESLPAFSSAECGGDVDKRKLRSAEGGDVGRVMVVKRRADMVFDKMPEKRTKVLNVLDGSEGYSVGAEIDGFVEEEGFDEMPMKKSRILTGSDEINLVGDRVFGEMLSGNQEVEMGIDDSVGIEEGCEFSLEKDESEMGLDEDTRTQVVRPDDEIVGSEEDCKFGVERDESEMGLDEVTRIQVVDLDDDYDENKEAGREDENKSTQVVDLVESGTCGDSSMRNVDVEMGNIATVDVNSDELYGDLITRNILGKSGPTSGDEVRIGVIRRFSETGIRKIDNSKCVSLKDDKNRGKDIGNSGLCDDLSQRGKEAVKALKIGSSEKGIVPIDKPEENNEGIVVGGSRKPFVNKSCGGVIRNFSEFGIRKIDSGKCVSLKDDENRGKDIGNSGLYDELSQRGKEIVKALNKGGEPCRDENGGSSEKGIVEIDKLEENNDGISVGGSNKPSVNKPCGGVIRGLLKKHANTSKGDNDHQKGKSQARKFPSTIDTLGETAISESDLSRSESSKGAVEKNKCENEISKPVGGETVNDEVMQNLLDGLDLLIGLQKKKVDDGSNKEVDLLETAMKLGMVFPRPRWWPEEGFGDD